MTDRRTPLFPLQALRIADVRSPVACEKPRDAQLSESVTIAANCVTARNCSSARVLIPGHKRARGLNTQAAFLATSANVCLLLFWVCAQYLAFLTTRLQNPMRVCTKSSGKAWVKPPHTPH